MELWEEVNMNMKQLDSALKTLRNNGQALADAEYNYKIELSKASLALRDSGTPVTMIPLVVYGDKKVAELRLKRDICQVTYDANKEAINIKKKELEMLKVQWEKEYGS